MDVICFLPHNSIYPTTVSIVTALKHSSLILKVHYMLIESIQPGGKI